MWCQLLVPARLHQVSLCKKIEELQLQQRKPAWDVNILGGGGELQESAWSMIHHVTIMGIKQNECLNSNLRWDDEIVYMNPAT